MYAPTYVWILQMFYNVGWWNNTGNSSCTPEIMMAVLNGTLGTIPNGIFFTEDNSRKTISGLVRNFQSIWL